LEDHRILRRVVSRILRETHWKLEILGSRNGASIIPFVGSAKSSGAGHVRAGYSDQRSGIANATAGHGEGPGGTIVVHVGGADRRGGGDDDRLVELALDFPLAGGVEAVWNGSHAGAPLVSIIGAMACIPS
jgi:hypothetical protein